MKANRQAELKKIVKDSYEIMSEHFNATRSKMAAADFLWAANKINNKDYVFDAGCGNGRLLDYILTTPNKYLGADNSSALIQVAQSRYPQFKFIKKDLNNLDDLTYKNFSVIFCSAVIIHIPDKKNRIKLLSNFYKLARPGAKLIISSWKMKGSYYRRLKIKSFFKNFFSWRDLVFPWLDQDGKAAGLRYYHYFSKSSFKQEIKRAGWQIAEELDDKYNFWIVAIKK